MPCIGRGTGQMERGAAASIVVAIFEWLRSVSPKPPSAFCCVAR